MLNHMTPETGARHPYIEGVQTKRGSDGRVYRLCRACLKPANAGRHRMTGAPIAPAQVTNAHPFALGGETQLNKAGQTLRLCAECHKPGNAPAHRAAAIRRVYPNYSPPEAKAEAPREAHPFVAGGVAPPDRRGAVHPTCATCGKIRNAKGRHLPREGAEDRTRAARAAPTQRAAARVRPGSLPAAELVALAISVDRLLALPADTLGWKLRMRLGDVRECLGVPVYPSLLAPDAPKDPEAPSPDLIERRPELRPREVPVAAGAVLPRPNITGLLRGIQSGRHRELVKRAVDQGWDVAMTGGGHVALTRGHRRLVVSTTVREGRGRGWANLRAEAKRVGLDVGTL